MNARIEAGRLSHADLGKVVTVRFSDDLGSGEITAAIRGIRHLPSSIMLHVGPWERPVLIDPHTLVTITQGASE